MQESQLTKEDIKSVMFPPMCICCRNPIKLTSYRLEADGVFAHMACLDVMRYFAERIELGTK
jgi:hypothetical protein